MSTQVKITEVNLDVLMQNLAQNGFNVTIAENSEQARQKVLELVPKGAEVMTASSVTLDTLGLTPVFNDSGEYDSVKAKLMKLDRKTQSLEMQKLGAAPEYVIGSVHAVTEDGHVVIASASGSQLPAYVYGSSRVVWVVGAQKLVKDVSAGVKRVYEVVLPKESERVKKVYGLPHSDVAKLLIYNQEFNPGRINLILVKEALGY